MEVDDSSPKIQNTNFTIENQEKKEHFGKIKLDVPMNLVNDESEIKKPRQTMCCL